MQQIFISRRCIKKRTIWKNKTIKSVRLVIVNKNLNRYKINFMI